MNLKIVYFIERTSYSKNICTALRENFHHLYAGDDREMTKKDFGALQYIKREVKITYPRSAWRTGALRLAVAAANRQYESKTMLIN